MKMTVIVFSLLASFYVGVCAEKASNEWRKEQSEKTKKACAGKVAKEKNLVGGAILGLRKRLQNCNIELEKLEEELNYLSSSEYEERLCGPKEEVENEENE